MAAGPDIQQAVAPFMEHPVLRRVMHSFANGSEEVGAKQTEGLTWTTLDLNVGTNCSIAAQRRCWSLRPMCHKTML